MKHWSSRILPLLLRGLGRLPLPLMQHIGSLAGRFSFWRRNRMAQVTRRNIMHCFPERSAEQQLQLEKESLRQTGILAGEVVVVMTRPYDWLRRRILHVHGVEAVKQQIAEGKGLIVIAPHLGNWEVLGLYLAELAPVTSLYDPPRQVAVEEVVRSSRQKSGAKLVPTTRKGVVAVLQALKDGNICGILPDQVPNDAGGKFSEFFGQPTFTMTLIHKLIQRTGCNAVYGYAKRTAGGFEIIFKSAPQGIYSEDEQTSLRALNEGVALCVQELPEQYQWEYKRFKKQPDASDFYADMP